MKINYDHSKNQLKILSIHWGFSLGGVVKYAMMINNVNKYASVNIHNLCVLGLKWQYDPQSLEKLGVKKIEIKSRLDFSWIKSISHEIKSVKPDLIMTHGFNGHFLVMVTNIFNKHKIPMISSYHGLYHAISPGRKLVEVFFNKLTEYYIRNQALAVVAVAEHSKKYLIKKGVSSKKITVIHNGIEHTDLQTRSRKRLREEWGLSNNDILIGVVSRLDPVKGVSFLLDALYKLKKYNQNLKLVVIGTGACDELLKEQVRKHGLETKVIFTGFRSDVKDCLMAFDIFILPSLAEYHSIALLEAMSLGKAIIATNVGGNTESVRHEKEAFIVPPANSDALAYAIRKMSQDNQLRLDLGTAANKRFKEKFTVEKMVQRTAEWLMDCGRISKLGMN